MSILQDEDEEAGAGLGPGGEDQEHSSQTQRWMEIGREKEEELHQKPRLWARCLANLGLV
jgi:hypothetical protein